MQSIAFRFHCQASEDCEARVEGMGSDAWAVVAAVVPLKILDRRMQCAVDPRHVTATVL